MEVSNWKLLGSLSAVLVFVFLISGAAAYAENYHQFVAVLAVFGGIFLVIGTGLVVIAIFDKPIDKPEPPIPPPP